MRGYFKIKVVKHYELEGYLSQGWEVIDKTKSIDHTEVNYHVGISYKTMAQKYTEIIKDYERFGFKEQLFKEVAKSYDKDSSDYEPNGWGETDEVSDYMTNYDRVVQGYDAIEYNIKQKKSDLDIEFDFDDEELPY